jgi:transcriptional regulator with XRE-family HTH domain
MYALNTKMRSSSTVDRPEGALAYPAVVGQILARHRELRGEKQGEVAARVGLSQSAYSRLEKGDSVMNLAQLHKLCEELELTPGDVLQQADAMERQLRAQGVQVLHEKPDDAAAILVGLGLLAALLLSGGR